jgi:diguanylate cyclase (GGDEF)-like protein
VSNTVDTVAQRHPRATRRILTVAHLYVLTLPGATIVTAITGHTVLTVIGVFAMIGYYATAAHRYTHRTREQVAQARRDPLTGLPNRAVADDMLAEATRTSAPMTVALVDIDGLHMLNTSLGHAAGDQYITTVARRLAGAVPPGGCLVRQGGDEFTLLAPGVDPDQMAADIGAALAGAAVIAGYRIQPRASVGIAASDGADANHIRAQADAALYTAKRDGGNQVLIYRPDRDSEPAPDGTRPLLRRRDINPLAAAGVAWLPAPGDELIPLLLSVADTHTLRSALSTARGRWAQAAADAQAQARRPEAPRSGDPGWMSIQPTPAGYLGIARIAADQQARYARLIDRLDPIIAATPVLDDAAPSSAAAPSVASVVLVGISAAFTPGDIEALVITAAQVICDCQVCRMVRTLSESL